MLIAADWEVLSAINCPVSKANICADLNQSTCWVPSATIWSVVSAAAWAVSKAWIWELPRAAMASVRKATSCAESSVVRCVTLRLAT